MKLLKLVPDNTNLDFMAWRNIALILSIIVTVASLVLVGVRGLNLGVDFVGGQMIRRRRYLDDGEPMELATSYIPWELAEGTPIGQPDTGPGGI